MILRIERIEIDKIPVPRFGENEGAWVQGDTWVTASGIGVKEFTFLWTFKDSPLDGGLVKVEWSDIHAKELDA